MYKHLLEQSFDAIAIHKEGKIAFLNEKAVKILGGPQLRSLSGDQFLTSFIRTPSGIWKIVCRI